MQRVHRLARVPFALIGLRFGLAPILGLLLSRGHVAPIFFVLLSLALVSDVADGMIARRIGTSSVRLRILDGAADVTLYIGLGLAVIIAHRADAAHLALPIAILGLGRFALYGFSYVRFGRGPSYHGLTAKAWGLGLSIGFALIAANIQVLSALWIALVLGYINTIDELAMTAILPAWHTDVLTIRHAEQLRRNVQGSKPAPGGYIAQP